MTLPSLLNRARAKELEVGLKKSYSLLEQVMLLMMNGEGQTITPEAYSSHRFAPAFNKYLIAAKACPHADNSNCLIRIEGETDEVGALIGYDFGDYKTFNGKANIEGSLMDNGQFLLRDGVTIYVENENITYISVDVNGMHKGPNLWGHDLFTFQLMQDGKIMPMGADGTSFSSKTLCVPVSKSKYNGIACTYKALTEKDYFKNLH